MKPPPNPPKRRLKVFRAHLGFNETIVAAPSQAAALEAWGVRQNLFHEGLASVAQDSEARKAALDLPGVVLRRPFGSKEKFVEEPALPKVRGRSNRARRAHSRTEKKIAAREREERAAEEKALTALAQEKQGLAEKFAREKAALEKRHSDALARLERDERPRRSR